MDNAGDVIVIILIWGILAFLFLHSLPATNKNSANFFSSLISSLERTDDQEIKGIINVAFDGENFQESTVHFKEKINIFDIKPSSSDQQLIFGGSDAGLFVSHDQGLTWQLFANQEKILNKMKILKILFVDNFGFISTIANGEGIIYQSEDNFSSLQKILDFKNETINDFSVAGQNLFAGLSDGRLLKYSLENKSVKILNKFNSAITLLKARPGGLVYLTLKSGGFWVSRNFGESFERMKFLDDYSGANKIFNFQIDLQDNSLIYAATDYGLIRSSDYGNTWQVFRSLPGEEQEVQVLALGKKGEIFATVYDKIYKSVNGGKDWRILYPEIKNNREISVINLNGRRLIIGSRTK